MIITSLQNPRLKALVKLRKRPWRDAAGLFIIEGYRPIMRALEAGIQFQELYYCPEWYLGNNELTIVETIRQTGSRVTQLGSTAFAKVAYRERPEGLLAIARQWDTKLTDLKLSKNPCILIVEAIEKPGNLGTMLRCADAAGMDALIICDPVTDLFNPNVVRSSTGVLFSMQTVITTSESALGFLKQHHIQIIATTPTASRLYTELDMTGRIAIVMGSEQFGLSSNWLKAADITARIPMAGRADSLNVAMAAVITLFEAVRQRKI